MTVEEQYEIGFQYRCEGQYDLAKQALHKVLEMSPGHVKARWQLALIAQFEGDFEGSLEGLRAVAHDAPRDLDVRYDYAMTLMMLGFVDEACSEFRAILEIDPAHEKAKQQLSYCQ
jgi:tetratricopeptide (TPR) repeat protein